MSELVSNTDRVIAGTPFSILKNKREEQRHKATNLFTNHASSGNIIP